MTSTAKWNAMLYWQGMAYNLFLPGGIGGDAYKMLAYPNVSKSCKNIICPYWLISLLDFAPLFLVGVLSLIPDTDDGGQIIG